MKQIRFFSFGVLAAVLLLVVAGIGLPGSYHTDVALSIQAPPSTIFNQINQLSAWKEWALTELSAGATERFMGPEEGLGAVYEWESKDSNGRMEIVESQPPLLVGVAISTDYGAFLSKGQFTLSEVEGGVLVRWEETGEYGWNPIVRVAASFFGYEKKVEESYLRSLEKLKAHCETISK